VLVITFTLGWVIVFQARIMGLLLAVLLTSWFFKYCFILLDAVVAGAEEPPVLSIEMVNPVDEQRPLAQAALIAGGAWLAFESGKLTVAALGWLTGGILLLLLPASIAVLGMSSNLLRAAWPPELLSVIRGIGRDYVALLVLIGAVAALVYAVARAGAASWLLVATLQLGLLTVFALVGGALHEHRLELGIEFRTSRERLVERTERERISERNRMLDDAYARFRLGKPLEGWQEIQSWLKLHGHAEDLTDKLLLEHRAVLATAAGWDDVRPADRLTDDLVELYFARRETGRALEVVEERLTTNPRYRPKNPGHSARLVELAGAAGKRALRRQLTDDPKGA
ncbi:MAG TPA: hypothetical protein VI653_21705, partial [Steroidobacteraceae bacterium]